MISQYDEEALWGAMQRMEQPITDRELAEACMNLGIPGGGVEISKLLIKWERQGKILITQIPPPDLSIFIRLLTP